MGIGLGFTRMHRIEQAGHLPPMALDQPRDGLALAQKEADSVYGDVADLVAAAAYVEPPDDLGRRPPT